MNIRKFPNLDQHVGTLTNSVEREHNVVGENLLIDHRVSDERWEILDKFLLHKFKGITLSANDLHKELSGHGGEERSYFNRLVRYPELPEFMERQHNGSNRIYPSQSLGKLPFHPSQRFCRLFNLSQFGFAFESAKNDAQFPKSCRDFLVNHGFQKPGDFETFLQNTLKPDPLTHQVTEEFREWFFDLMYFRLEIAQKTPPDKDPRLHHPYWCTFAEEIETLITKFPNEPERWLGRIGVMEPRIGDWIALTTYKVTNGNVKLFRPTTLDSGAYSLHFPSPPDHPLEKGGLALDSNNDHTAGLAPEFIHGQFEDPHPATRTKDFRVWQVSKPLSTQHNSDRKKHLSRLKNHHHSSAQESVNWYELAENVVTS